MKRATRWDLTVLRLSLQYEVRTAYVDKKTVHSPQFFRKIVRIECLPVRAAILVLYVPREWALGLIAVGEGS